MTPNRDVQRAYFDDKASLLAAFSLTTLQTDASRGTGQSQLAKGPTKTTRAQIRSLATLPPCLFQRNKMRRRSCESRVYVFPSIVIPHIAEGLRPQMLDGAYRHPKPCHKRFTVEKIYWIRLRGFRCVAKLELREWATRSFGLSSGAHIDVLPSTDQFSHDKGGDWQSR